MKGQPNIIFILADDQGAWAMERAGNTDIKTPHLNHLADNGVLFDNFYCASPVCSPARASLATGKIPSSHGVQDWISGGNMDAWKYPELSSLPGFDPNDEAIDYLEEERTYMDVLAENGYTCALSGKWHLGDNPTKKSGFSKWYTIGRGGCPYYQPDIFDEGEPAAPGRYVTQLITERALGMMNEMAEQENPFYLSVHYTAPHSPWEAEEHPAEFLDWYRDCDFMATPDLPVHPQQIQTCPIGDTPEKRKENLTGYYAAISAMDAGIGEIIKKLKEKDLLENTVIIFTSDNGMNMGHHGIWGKGNGTYPPNMFDTSIKVPLIICHPSGKASSGTVCSNMVSQYDIFPTILELAGCSFESEPLQPGSSMMEFIHDPKKQQDKEVVVFDEYGKTRMIKKNNYKYIHRYPKGPHEFYDMLHDPGEEHNLYGKKQSEHIIKSLKTEMEEWFQQFTREKMDARKQEIKGTGQKNRCYKKDAFLSCFDYYH